MHGVRASRCAQVPPGAASVPDRRPVHLKGRQGAAALVAVGSVGEGDRAVFMDFGASALPSPFVGRQAELARLDAAWRRARRDGVQVVGLAGPAGSGKTTLLRAFAARHGDGPVVWAGGDWEEEYARPQPWSVVRRILGTRAEREGGRADPVPRIPGPGLAPVFAAEWLVGELRRRGGLVVVVDDAHHADELSMATLRLAVRQMDHDPLLLVLAYQEPRPSARGGLPGTPRVLHDGWTRLFAGGRGHAIRLGGLDPQELMELAVAARHPGLTPDAAAKLCRHTDGNPQHLVQLLDQIPMHSLVYGLGPHRTRGLPSAVLARLASCGRSTRDLLTAGTVLGRSFRLRDAQALCEVADVSAAVEQAVTAGLLEEVPGTAGRELVFGTALIRDCVYGDMSIPRRRALHARAAALGGTDALWHRIEAADGTDPALADEAYRVAQDHLLRGRLRLAAACSHHSLDLTPPGPGRVPRLLGVVETLLIAGDVSTARRYESEVAAVPPGPWRDYVAGYLALLSGRPDEARGMFLSALSALDDTAGAERAGDDGPAGAAGERSPLGAAPADLDARISAQMTVLAIVMLDYRSMTAYGARALRAGSGAPFVTASAAFGDALGRALAGEADKVLVSLDDAASRTGPAGLDGLVARGVVRLWTDDLDGAEADLRLAVERAMRGEVLRVGQAPAFLGETMYRAGRLDEAVRYALLAVGDAEENDRYRDLALANALACYPLAAQARWQEARAHADEASRWAFTGHAGRACAAGARAAIAQAEGDLPALLRAAEEIEKVYDSREPGTHLFGPLRADALVQLGRCDEAESALAGYLAGLAVPGRASARAAVQRVRALIAAARGRHTAAARLAASAARTADAAGLPLEAGRAQLVLARCEHAAGHPAAAERALRAALRRFRDTGAEAYVRLAHRLAGELTLPTTTAPLAVLDRLTATEREIALLVGHGLANSRIAERRHVVLKTVETHLNHVYAKLDLFGADKREQLVRLVTEPV